MKGNVVEAVLSLIISYSVAVITCASIFAVTKNCIARFRQFSGGVRQTSGGVQQISGGIGQVYSRLQQVCGGHRQVRNGSLAEDDGAARSKEAPCSDRCVRSPSGPVERGSGIAASTSVSTVVALPTDDVDIHTKHRANCQISIAGSLGASQHCCREAAPIGSSRLRLDSIEARRRLDAAETEVRYESIRKRWPVITGFPHPSGEGSDRQNGALSYLCERYPELLPICVLEYGLPVAPKDTKNVSFDSSRFAGSETSHRRRHPSAWLKRNARRFSRAFARTRVMPHCLSCHTVDD